MNIDKLYQLPTIQFKNIQYLMTLPLTVLFVYQPKQILPTMNRTQLGRFQLFRLPLLVPGVCPSRHSPYVISARRVNNFDRTTIMSFQINDYIIIDQFYTSLQVYTEYIYIYLKYYYKDVIRHMSAICISLRNNMFTSNLGISSFSPTWAPMSSSMSLISGMWMPFSSWDHFCSRKTPKKLWKMGDQVLRCIRISLTFLGTKVDLHGFVNLQGIVLPQRTCVLGIDYKRKRANRWAHLLRHKISSNNNCLSASSNKFKHRNHRSSVLTPNDLRS